MFTLLEQTTVIIQFILLQLHYLNSKAFLLSLDSVSNKSS